jgi:protein CpxP
MLKGMIMNKMKRTLLLSLCMLSMGSAAAYAQQSAPADQWQAHKAEMQQHMQQRMEQHWQHLHDALKISAAQEPAWQAFRAASVPPARTRQAAPVDHHEHQAMEKLSAPEHMEKMLEMMKKRQAQFETHLAAVKSFYGQLNAEQQKTFNEHFMHAMHRMHHGHFGHGMHGGDWHHE